MECDNFDGSICLNLESNNYAKDCDKDCSYYQYERLKHICNELKKRNIIETYATNSAYTNVVAILNYNLNMDELKRPLFAILIEEFAKQGYYAECDDGIEMRIDIRR